MLQLPRGTYFRGFVIATIVLLSINATLDGRLTLHLAATGETVVARPGFAVLLAYNPGLVGATDGRKAVAGTIRGDFSLSNRENLVHASDSPDSAKREIALWFPDLAS